ncbi:BcCCH1, calcium channel protein [Mollisia scopiformis]|uniref:Calcium-channel protein CCH1 n=1 Tax=Mollisia scopiformis TaxID=149040 RepID=A0A194XJU7_MOLSC|nr:BcCCH1, calcium channel protein [Mollisia scopiformis]KUJ20384.1 BcCCH1, calcium channel protein [Mollisia scopiformis]
MPHTDSQNSTHPSTPPETRIELRDLGARPPDSADIADWEQQHSRGRSLLGGGSRPTSGGNAGPRYERLGDASPSPTERQRNRGPPLTVPSRQLRSVGDEHGTPVSPVGNPADFQAAMGFAGLLVPDISVSHAPLTHTSSYGSGDFDDGRSSFGEQIRSPYGDSAGDDPSYFPSESDTVPLTDPTSLQLPSGVRPTTPDGQRHDRSRSSFQSINFDTPDTAYRGSRLGDDLMDVEAGVSPHGGRSRSHSYGNALTPDGRTRSRSPSNVGALSRAGSIMRAMSTRVVNPEIAEITARIEASRDESIPSTLGSLSDESETRYQPKRKENPLAAGPNYRQNLPTAPVEKAMRFFGGAQPEPEDDEEPDQPPNPLRGKTLNFFSPESKLRRKLCDILVYPLTEPAILILIVVQTVLLAVDASQNVYEHPRPTHFGQSPIDLALLGLFVIFTIEMIARIIVSGLIYNAAEYSSRPGKKGFKSAIMDKYETVFKPQRQRSLKIPRNGSVNAPTVVRSFTAIQSDSIRTVEQAQRLQLARRAFLRHSFNRLDFLAVIAFWTAFILGLTGIEDSFHLYIFRMLSCLRIVRLLALTNGTAIILRSLKKAAPLLVNVSFLIGFFWLLFAIIGVQSFKSSFDRQCVWIDPSDPFNNSGLAYTQVYQFCGGQFNNETGAPEPYVTGTFGNAINQVDSVILQNGPTSHKGYLCPRGSYCLQLLPDQLPYNGTVSFDNIFQSLELVFVIMTANTFTDLMYYTMNSDYLAAALFFAGGIMIMMLWLLNLLIAVITSSFQVIREEGRASAFAAHVKGMLQTKESDTPRRKSKMKALYDKTYWLWIIVIAYGLLCEGFRSSIMSVERGKFINESEVVVTFILLVEILIRFSVDWRGFFQDNKNWVDLALAVITTVILIPPIMSSGQPYAWLSVFQILRIYRLIIAVPITRALIMLVLGNSSGIANLMLFVFLTTFLMSIFAVQLFRGELTQTDPYGNVIHITFFTIYNAFLGMYQILSSENWTINLYNITAFDTARNTAWIGAVFFIGWFILGNFILVNMFIAVIQENFDVSEDEKRMHQVKSFLNRKELGNSSSNLSLSAIFRFGRNKSTKDPLDYGPATMEMLLKDAVVKDFLDDEADNADQPTTPPSNTPPVETASVKPGFISSLWGRFMTRIWNREPNPFYSNIQFSLGPDEQTDARTMAKEAVNATSQRKKAQREFLARHPNYNTALFIFKPQNPIRRLCQKIVGPGRGSERFDGVEPNTIVWYTFSAFIYAAIVAMVLLACITTPLYQKEYFNTHTFNVRNWFVWADMSFAALFTIEALIKIIADGFFWTPNAYFRSTWGFIDGIVLITFWINVITSLSNDGAVSRAVGAFKALRALRLLNVSDSARDTFHSLITVGIWKIVSAAFVSLSLLIPFAIYGVNLFNGQMLACNDLTGTVSNNLSDCFGEYTNTPYSNNWPVLSPRVVSNPYYSFDNFGSALFILFQIVSQEGWVDVMWSAESITGRGLQPASYAAQGNAMFFVIFNLLATVFVLTLFISVFMRNYTEQTGVAFLTADQRSWLELRKLLRQVSPSKRPLSTEGNKFKDWCYKRAVRKHGRWHQAMTIVLVLHLLLLLVEYYPEPAWWDSARTYIFLGFTVFYTANVIVRIVGLSWSRYRRSSWDLYALLAVAGTLASTVLLLTQIGKQSYIQLHKLFLVAIVLLLIPRNDALDQLFKTAAASLTNIGNLLATWFVLFLVFAIALTQTFGLTRFGSNETDNLNFRTVPKALILLFRISCGEGWNQIMEDYATILPPLCVDDPSFFNSDCGSTQWARALFISWNILSMYIFTSLFVSLIYESFSYVYQHSSGLGKVSREEIRRFKQAWATLDPEGTGFISKEQFPRLLGELSGVFEMRIYPHEHSVRRILEDIQSEPTSGRIVSMASTSAAPTVNLKSLNKRLAEIDPVAIRLARARYNLFFEEVMVSADVDRGISFTTVLMILAHYNVISDNKSLKLEEFLRRRARLQRVEEEVRRRIVLGFFDTMYWSRRFRKHLESKRSGRMTDIPQLGPEVFVDDDDIAKQARTKVSPLLSPPSPMDKSDTRSSFIAHGLDGAARHRRGSSLGGQLPPGPLSPGSPGISPGVSPRGSPQLSPHRPTNSAYSFEGGELTEGAGSAHSSRRGSAVTAENVLEVLDNSAWGESIRRSFTMRRPNRGGTA